MDLGLKNKVALIAAASRGLGRAVAEELAAEGTQLVICSRSEEKINQAVEADYPIRVYSLPREKAFAIPDLIRTKINLLPPEIEEIRIVEIVGLDLQADGGTHVNHTKEVGAINITKTENKGKINKRLEIRLVD